MQAETPLCLWFCPLIGASMTPILENACPTQPSSTSHIRSFTEAVWPHCGPRSLIWASPTHPHPSCSHRVLHQQLLHRGGRREFLQAAGAAPGRERDQAQRHAARRTPLPARRQPHRDLSGPRTGRRARAPMPLCIWLDGLVWLLLEGLGQTM